MPSDDRPFRLDVPEPDPPPHLIEQLAEAARQSAPTRRAGRRAATVSVGAVALLAGVGGAWATGALPVPGLPDGGLPAIVERSRDGAPDGRPSDGRSGPADAPSAGSPGPSGGATPSRPGTSRAPSPDGPSDGSSTDRPDEQRPSGRPSPGGPRSSVPPTAPPTSPPTSPPASPPSATPSDPDRGGGNPGRGDDRRNQDPGDGNRGQGQGSGRQQDVPRDNGQGNGQGSDRSDRDDSDLDLVTPGRGPDA